MIDLSVRDWLEGIAVTALAVKAIVNYRRRSRSPEDIKNKVFLREEDDLASNFEALIHTYLDQAQVERRRYRMGQGTFVRAFHTTGERTEWLQIEINAVAETVKIRFYTRKGSAEIKDFPLDHINLRKAEQYLIATVRRQAAAESGRVQAEIVDLTAYRNQRRRSS